jgi:hypothetical protein
MAHYLALAPIRFHGNTSQQPLMDYALQLPITTDADVVSLHEDAVYGVPWAHFMSNGTVAAPAFWTAHVARLRAATIEGGPWATASGSFLTLSLVNHGLGRTCPAGNASTPSNPNQQFAGCSGCFDFNVTTNPSALAVRAAYVRYVLAMVSTLSPRWVCFPEVNMFQSACSTEKWAAVVEFSNEVFAAVKAAHPLTGVFPSFQADFLRGQQDGGPCKTTEPDACLDANMGAVAPLRRDLFALSAYVYMHGVTGTPGARPPSTFSGYLEAILRRVDPSEPLAIAETGFLTTTLSVFDFTPSPSPLCFPLLASSEADAAGWMTYLFGVSRGAYAGRFELITWWSDSDLLPEAIQSGCFPDTPPCAAIVPPLSQLDLVYCSITNVFRQMAITSGQPAWSGDANLKAFGTMGLRTHGTLKLKPMLGDVWQSQRTSAPPPPSRSAAHRGVQG